MRYGVGVAVAATVERSVQERVHEPVSIRSSNTAVR